MRVRLVILAALWALGAQPVHGQHISQCSKIERRAVDEALRNAKRLTLSSAAAVADTPAYARWFGKYTPRRADQVRANLKAVYTAIRSGRVTTHCAPVGFGSCAADTYAFVYAERPYRVHVCPAFFGLPTMASLDPGHHSGDNGTREGTFIHEISHFDTVALTEDHCYSRSDCSRMAGRDPVSAVENADSYQYFTEDVTHFREEPLADKPGRAVSDAAD